MLGNDKSATSMELWPMNKESWRTPAFIDPKVKPRSLGMASAKGSNFTWTQERAVSLPLPIPKTASCYPASSNTSRQYTPRGPSSLDSWFPDLKLGWFERRRIHRVWIKDCSRRFITFVCNPDNVSSQIGHVLYSLRKPSNDDSKKGDIASDKRR